MPRRALPKEELDRWVDVHRDADAIEQVAADTIEKVLADITNKITKQKDEAWEKLLRSAGFTGRDDPEFGSDKIVIDGQTGELVWGSDVAALESGE